MTTIGKILKAELHTAKRVYKEFVKLEKKVIFEAMNSKYTWYKDYVNNHMYKQGEVWKYKRGLSNATKSLTRERWAKMLDLQYQLGGRK